MKTKRICEGRYRDYEQNDGKLVKCHDYAVHIHHKNRDRSDNRPVNLMHLCAKCHKREHTGETGKGSNDQPYIDAYDEINEQRIGYRITRGFSMLGFGN